MGEWGHIFCRNCHFSAETGWFGRNWLVLQMVLFGKKISNFWQNNFGRTFGRTVLPKKHRNNFRSYTIHEPWLSCHPGRENATPTAKSRFLLKTGKVLFWFHSFEWIQVVNQAESTLDLVCGRGLLQRKAAEPQNLSHKSQQNITVLRMKARKAGWHSPSPVFMMRILSFLPKELSCIEPLLRLS